MVITDVILPAISDITEKVILTVIILPLFLLNQIVAAIDIFAGIQDIGEVEMPTSIFSDAPVRLAGRAAPILACPHADAETDAERLWFAAWQDYIDASASVVMRRTAATNDPVRYYPHIRTFMEENDIPFGSRQMYKVIADAIVAGIPIGAGLTVNDISSRVRTPSTEEFVSKMRFLAPDEDNILNRPNHPYNSDSFVFLENLVIDLSFIEEMLNDADDSEGDPIEMSQHEYERILRLLFIDAYNRNLISPNHFENRLKYLRDNPHMDNSNELNRMTDPSYVVDFSVVRRFIGVNNTTSRTRHDDFVSIPHPRFGDIFTGQGDILNPHIWGNEYMRGLYLDYLGNIGGGWNPGSGGGWNPGSGGWNPGSGGWNPGDIGDTGEEKPQRTVSWIFLNFLDGLKDVEEKAADVSGNLQWREWVGYRDEIYRALKTLKIDLDDLREYGPYLGTPFRESLTGIRDIIIGWSHASAVRSDYEYALQTLSGVAGMMSGEFGSIVRISPIAAAEPEFYQARLEISLAALLEKYDYLQSVLENSDYWEEIIRGLSEELPENDTSPPASEEDGYDDSPLVPGNPDIDTEALEEYITAVSEWSALRPSLEYYFLLGNMELLREPDYHRRSELSALLNDIRYDFEPHRIDYNSETAIKNRPLTHGNTTYRTPYGHLVALGISDIDLVYSYVNYNTPWYNLIDVFYALQAELLELEEDEEAENRNLRLQQLHTRLFRLGVGAELIRGYDDDPSLILEAIKARYIALDSEFNSENIAGLISMRAALNAMGISEAYIFELTGVILNSDITEEMLWSQLMNYFFQGWYSNTFFMTYNISFGNAFDNLFLDDDNDNSGEYINTEAIYEAANLITLTTFYPANIIWKDYIQHNRDIVADPERAFNDPLRYHENI
ncbi:MAG: hypothetical protein LBC86_00285, partial [Oscillospiraceae bacterium]|nr:hypothetical protein [Oscillospiraceae bacterium]